MTHSTHDPVDLFRLHLDAINARFDAIDRCNADLAAKVEGIAAAERDHYRDGHHAWMRATGCANPDRAAAELTALRAASDALRRDLATRERAKCVACGAVVEYMPEEVEERNGTDISGGPAGWRRVKCPRPGCPGYAYERRW